MDNNSSAVPTSLGTEPIGKLLKAYAVPAIIAMTASSLYNMVDSIYIGHMKDVGPLAISGLAVTFPLMNLSAAFGTLVGAGASTIISVLLGQRDYEKARKVLANTATLNFAIGFLFMALTLAFLDPILYFFGASDQTIQFARRYMDIILYGNIITHMYFGFNGILRSAGRPKLAMGLTIFTVVFNSVLDPIMIFWMGLGIRGAAWATVISQFLAMCYAWGYFMNKKNCLHFPKRVFGFNYRIAKSSLEIGMGPFLMNAASCIVAVFINKQLFKYGGDLSIGAYGIVNRISFLFVMIMFGFNQAMQPIAGYNFGAKKYSRVREIFYKTVMWASAVSVLGFLISMFAADPAVSVFTTDAELKSLADKALRTINLCFFIVGFQMVATNLFQCLGMVRKSIFLSLTRQLLCLVPLLYILPLNMGVKGVWYSFPASDGISAALTVAMLLALIKKMRTLKDGDSPDILGSQIS